MVLFFLFLRIMELVFRKNVLMNQMLQDGFLCEHDLIPCHLMFSDYDVILCGNNCFKEQTLCVVRLSKVECIVKSV